jgi:lysyl-tRNA synthetase class 2
MESDITFGEHKLILKRHMPVTMTILSKHFTGYFSGKSEAELFEAARGMGIVWMKLWGKEN